MSKYIYIFKKNLIGETILKLKADKVTFQVGDIVYVSENDKKIHSRWHVVKRNDKLVMLFKEPENVVSVNYKEKLEGDYEEKINLLSNKDADILDKYFLHKITILPFYDVESKSNFENEVLNELRKYDYKIEVYTEEVKGGNIYNEQKNNNFIIAENFGVISFECIEKNIFNNRDDFEELKKELNSEDLMEKLLLNSSILTNDGTNLEIGYKKFFIVKSEKQEEYYRKINEILKNNGFDNIFIVNIRMFINSIFEIINNQNEKIINKDKHFGILQMLIPQYINSKVVNVNTDKIKFMPESSYEIDNNQKSILSSMNKRVYLKAAAGSGKTILLLAKAYEVAITNPEKEFLIICYNNKLAEDIRIQAENTGKVVSNLRIYTLDAFIQEEITQYSGKDNRETFNVRREIFVEKVRNGKYTKKFGGIFLDEMQQLEEEWISALVECLDNNKYMVIAGDYYQQIRLENNSNEEDDDLSDENTGDEFCIGKYNFEKIILDRNYRNTDEIVKIVNKMLREINEFTKKLQIPIENKEKRAVIGKGVRRSTDKPQYIHVKSEEEEIETIIKYIEDLIKNKEYTPNEILLVSPWGKSSVHLIYKLKQKIEERNIQICDFERSRLSKDGIRLGTIGKAIGLDFKAVIIFGTNMLQSMKGEEKISFDSYEELEKQNISVKKVFIKYLKNIYVACSRARDTLIVVDDIKKSSLISEFLKLVGDSKDE